MREITFSMIKPNAMKMEKQGIIIDKFQQKGLKIVAIKMIHISKELCENFYLEHKEKPFFLELVNFISSHPVLVMALEGEDAIFSARQIMGHTDPKQADPGTIRHEFGQSITENASHGSDSSKSAERELKLFFTKEEVYSNLWKE